MIDLLIKPELHFHDRRDVWYPTATGYRVDVPAYPSIRNPERRRACRWNFPLYKHSYFPWYRDVGFFHPRFLEICSRLVLSAGIVRKAIAAARGIGKTMDAVIANSWALAYGHRKYCPWICRRIDYAEKRVGMIRYIFQHNAILREDFPELCMPFVGMTPQQIKPPLKMSTTELVLPNGGASVAFSIESALRGLVLEDGTRPDLINLDDIIETDQESEAETGNLIEVIEGNLEGLAELGGDLAMLMLVTVPTVGSVPDIYTDPKQKPAWNGERFRAMLKPPERLDLWERYKEICAGAEVKPGELEAAA